MESLAQQEIETSDYEYLNEDYQQKLFERSGLGIHQEGYCQREKIYYHCHSYNYEQIWTLRIIEKEKHHSRAHERC